MSNAIFTICSRNYLGQAKTLMQSVRQFEPDTARYIVLVDRKVENPEVAADEAAVIWIEDLDIPDVEFKALIFDVLELNTNVKPTVMRHLLAQHRRCAYLDPDTFLYGPFTPVWEGLDAANVVVTPHLIDPESTVDRVMQQDLLRHGGFNLGFIGVAATPEADRFLAWWEQCCLNFGFHAPADGLFVDQKFVDHAHMYFDGVKVLRHRGLNIAYWNLHERPMRHDGARWMAGNDPLVFMHFSGFIYAPRPDQQDLITKYPTVTTLVNRPEIRPLFDDYRERLRANAYPDLARLPYSFNTFDNGAAVTRMARRLVGTGVVAAADRRQPFRADGPVYRALEQAGALEPVRAAGRPAPKRDAAGESTQAGRAHAILRWLYRRLGPTRYEFLLRFLTLIGSTLNQGFLVKR